MLVRDSTKNEWHIVWKQYRSNGTKKYRYVALCGVDFANTSTKAKQFQAADFYTRCPECRRLFKARVGQVVS